MCGEQIRRLQKRLVSVGSSPRVRGTDSCVRPLPSGLRFIPACAGNSQAAYPSRCWLSVHPRVCGEQWPFRPSHYPRNGSSPRVRGTAGKRRGVEDERRFIPACAGNSAFNIGRNRFYAVHPRVCGEQTSVGQIKQTEVGSSPRVRGTARSKNAFADDRRFIPACAGNSPSHPGYRRRRPVHPRVCGEQSESCESSLPSAGSSPRVRGTGKSAHKSPRHLRFIPACAGNRAGTMNNQSRNAVHPRVCGEQLRRSPRPVRLDGSSPRVRGTVRISELRVHLLRFIPACAGNRITTPKSTLLWAVHPRVCGEQCRSPAARLVHAGSSPRVRGTDFWKVT